MSMSHKRKQRKKSRSPSQPKARDLVPAHAGIRGSVTHAIILKQNDLFFLTEPDGMLPLEEGHGFGLYHRDCRFLNGYEMRIAGTKPEPLVRNANDSSSAVLGLSNPRIKSGRQRISKERVEIRWSRALSSERLALFDTITFKSFARKPIRFSLTLEFCADFQDVFAIRGHSQRKRGKQHPPTWTNGALNFLYEGADSINRSVTIHFSPAPAENQLATARFQIHLMPKQPHNITVSIFIAERAQGKQVKKTTNRKAARIAEAESLDKRTKIHSDNVLLNRVIDRSMRDLRMLRSQLDGINYFAGGIPWFVALFGRDSIITALQTLAYNPRIAEQTLRLFAKHQGTKLNRSRDEEPGKILHELRVGEMAHLGEVPYSPYYGTIDATPLWLVLMARHAEWTADLRLFRELRSNVDAALNWMRCYGDCDGDGYLEYKRKTEQGLRNQGWKDSGDGIVNADGSFAEPPIALAEVQGYAYEARLGVAQLFHRVGEHQRGTELESEAQQLRERFNRDFWVDDGYFALALQKGKRQSTVLSSNAGQVLWSGIADDERARQTALHLLSPEMFNGWGIRTLSTAAKRYNPLGYHLGTVWPHDNSLIAAGFKRYKLDDAASRVLEGIVRAAVHFDGDRLPELFGGFSSEDYGVPVSYPAACQPQAWASGAVPYLIVTMLGLEPDAFSKKLMIVRPRLPQGVNRLAITGMRVGNAQIDLSFERRRDDTDVQIGSLQDQVELEVLQ